MCSPNATLSTTHFLYSLYVFSKFARYALFCVIAFGVASDLVVAKNNTKEDFSLSAPRWLFDNLDSLASQPSQKQRVSQIEKAKAYVSMLLDSLFANNYDIKNLQYEVKALSALSNAESKWENPTLLFGYNNAHITRPFVFGVDMMQNISIGLSQKLEINGAPKVKSSIKTDEAQTKIYELGIKKNALTLSLINDIINTHINAQILFLLDKSIQNLNLQLNTLKSSNTLNPIQTQKLQILKAKLQIRHNQLANSLHNFSLSASEASAKTIQLKAKNDTISELAHTHNTDSSTDDVAAKTTTNEPAIESLFANALIIIAQDFANNLIKHIDKPNATKNPPDNVAKTHTQGIAQEISAQILSGNYELALASQNLLISKRKISLSKLDFIPNIQLGLSYMFRANGLQDMFGFSLGMPLPIYGKQVAQKNLATLEHSKASSNLSQTQNKITHNIDNLLSKIQMLSQNLHLIERTLLPQNKGSIGLYSHHAISQGGSFLEFYSALNEHIDSEILRLETLGELARAYWELQSLKGD